MALVSSSIEWAIDFVARHSDGDLFPKILELEAILERKAEFAQLVAGKDLAGFQPGPHRRFIVPKDDVSYRQATQLDPQDSIILSAIVHQFGDAIERRRLPQSQVFSYRFAPSAQHGLYSSVTAWNSFWKTAFTKCTQTTTVLYCDIADFYNQIYHHVVENQLIEAQLPNQVIKWVLGLLGSTTAGVSRGVPVGPHAVHLIAEASLIPVDNSLKAAGLRFLRYADDVLVYCKSEREAREALATVASILDRQQRLSLQRHKTKFLDHRDFQAMCREMIEDRPISSNERAFLGVIAKYSGGNPYATISFTQISVEDQKKLTDDAIAGIIKDYLKKEPVDYIRLRWFYRRLAQIGHPGGIDISLSAIDKFGPCFANVCSYLASVQSIEPRRWKTIGAKLLKLLSSREVKASEYFRLSLLSLFTRNEHIDHFHRLASQYGGSDPFARREILLAATKNRAVDWLREHKEEVAGMDQWQRSAFIYGASDLPKDERKFFINSLPLTRPFDVTLAKWTKNK